MRPVFGSTGQAHVGYVDVVPTPSSYTQPVNNESILAGSNSVTKADNVGVAGLFAIEFHSVTFSGTQFKLFISVNGFSQINTTVGEKQDIQYGPTFSTADFSNTPTFKKTWAIIPGLGNSTFYIGNIAGCGGTCKIVEGPIPIQISNIYNYIKIFDGNSGAVAVTKEFIIILPGLSLSPTSGAAGTLVSATGGGFPTNKVIDLVYSFTRFKWTVGSTSPVGNWTTGVNTGPGYFTTAAKAMVDTKQAYNPLTGVQASRPVTISATLEHTPHTVFATATFTEGSRFFNQVKSLDSTGAVFTNDTPAGAPYGNDTGSGALLTNPIQVYVLGHVIIGGNNTAIHGSVSFWVGTTNIGSATADAAGYFNGTANIPALSQGAHTLLVNFTGVVYQFTINVNPTLILSPSKGPVGTHVTASAYGFPSNTKVFLYWSEKASGDGTEFWMFNATVGTDGAFNVSATFVVPHSYGGAHEVEVQTVYSGKSVSEGASQEPSVAEVLFTVTPTLVLCVSSTCGDGSTNSNTITINSNTRTLILVNGTGYNPDWLYINIDNALFSDCNTKATNTGDFNITFTGAGFRPGLHQVETWACSGSSIDQTGPPNGWAYFNVTTIGDSVAGKISGFTASINALQTSINNMQTTLNGMNTAISGLSTSISSLSTSVGNIQTTVGSINTAVTSLSTTLGTLGTKIDALSASLTSASGTLTSIGTKLDTISSSLSNSGSIGTQLSGIQSSVTSAQNAATTGQTYVLVVVALAAITLVLELAILVRKLS